MILSESHPKILDGLQDKKSLNVVKIPPQKTLKEWIDDLSKRFTEAQLNSIPVDVAIIFHNTNDDIAIRCKDTDTVSYIGMLECAKSLYLEDWHERDRGTTVYND